MEALTEPGSAPRLRKLVISAILSTDIAGHKDFVGAMAQRAAREAEAEGSGLLPPAEREQLVRRLCCAAPSSPCVRAGKV